MVSACIDLGTVHAVTAETGFADTFVSTRTGLHAIGVLITQTSGVAIIDFSTRIAVAAESLTTRAFVRARTG